MRNAALAAFAALASLTGTACVAPVGPVEVTRFHNAPAAPLSRGTIAVMPAPGMDASSLEYRTYAAAVARELQRLGFGDAGADVSAQVATLGFSQETVRAARDDNPVSVGVGGGTGSYGTGVGVGIGINLSGPPPGQVVTRLSVAISDRERRQVIWEGRASFTVRDTSPLADTQLGAARLAQALFKDFPGQSGATILVE